MVAMQFVYAIINLLGRDIFVNGMSRTVFAVYRLAFATLVICPIAYLTRDKSNSHPLTIRSFVLMFITAFIGLALCQNLYNEGLYLASSSIASAMLNLIPAITFLMAAILRLEQVNVKRLSSISKIVGTCICVGGAVSMALLRGPKLLNDIILPSDNHFQQFLSSLKNENETWLLGCLCLFGVTCCWSTWLILQVTLTSYCPNHISLSAWMCSLSMLQAGVIGLYLERDPNAWKLKSSLELIACLVAGIFGSGFQYFIQAWCISRKGPLFSALFSPLSTVMTTALASIFLKEQLYLGSLVGSIAVIIGLYVVLWGKSKEVKENLKLGPGNDLTSINLEQPLLKDCSAK